MRDSIERREFGRSRAGLLLWSELGVASTEWFCAQTEDNASGFGGSIFPAQRICLPSVRIHAMFVIPHGIEKFRRRAICFWLMDGPRSISLHENFDDGWLDRSCRLSTYTPVGHIGCSLQLFTNDASIAVARLFEWSQSKDRHVIPIINRRLLLLDRPGIDRFRGVIARVMALAPFHSESKIQTHSDVTASSGMMQVQCVRVERKSELGTERLGFGLRFDDKMGEPLNILDVWNNELNGELLDVQVVRERFDADPFESGIELDFEGFELLGTTFELPIELS